VKLTTMHATFSALDDRLRAAGRRLVDHRPQLESALLHARDGYARAYVRSRWLANRLRYDAPPAPYRLIEVDPAAVGRVAPTAGPKFKYAGVIVGGDWDLTGERFEETDVFRAYEHHFEAGVPWQETEFYDRVVDEIAAGTHRWGCRTRQEFDERCERLDRLYERIAEDGYRTQAELREVDGGDPIGNDSGGEGRRDLKTERLKNEIAVSVGRDGQLLFSDGRNRLSIVKLLDIDAVPVRVLHRHRRWQAVRDAYVRGDRVPHDHPDLAGLERGDG
jgi:hypothetical protein